MEHDFPKVTNYYGDDYKNFIQTALQSPNDYTYLIDKLPGNTVRPQLKCNSPCYTCLESDPDYCTSCWGVGEDGLNENIFLNRLPGQSTCLPHCEDGYTTDGNVFNPNDEPSKYYKCVECEMFCGLCKGQTKPDPTTGVVASYGEKGDKAKCITCS